MRPTKTAIAVAAMPTISEVRVPYIVRTKRSRPAGSQPKIAAPSGRVEARPERDAEVVRGARIDRVLRVAREVRRERAAEERDQDED